MKIHVFALDGCPHTRRISDMLLSYPHDVKELVPPRLVLHKENKIPVLFHIIPNHVETMKRICRTYGIDMIQSFPTMVKVENGRAEIFNGQTKCSLNRFLKRKKVR
jgi:hypothetical protein